VKKIGNRRNWASPADTGKGQRRPKGPRTPPAGHNRPAGVAMTTRTLSQGSTRQRQAAVLGAVLSLLCLSGIWFLSGFGWLWVVIAARVPNRYTLFRWQSVEAALRGGDPVASAAGKAPSLVVGWAALTAAAVALHPSASLPEVLWTWPRGKGPIAGQLCHGNALARRKLRNAGGYVTPLVESLGGVWRVAWER